MSIRTWPGRLVCRQPMSRFYAKYLTAGSEKEESQEIVPNRPCVPALNRRASEAKEAVLIEHHRDELKDACIKEMKAYVEQLYEKHVTKGSKSHDKFFADESKRKSVRIWDAVHASLFPNPTKSTVAIASLTRRVSKMEDFNTAPAYHEIVAEYQEELANNEDSSATDDNPSGSDEESCSDNDDTPGFEKRYETITRSLSFITRHDFDVQALGQIFTDEQARMEKFISKLTQAVSVAIELLGQDKLGYICGLAKQAAIKVDLKSLAPTFDFGKDAETAIKLTPCPDEAEKYSEHKVFSYEHFANILSGCVGKSVRARGERTVFNDIRQLINAKLSDDPDDKFFFNQSMMDALKQLPYVVYHVAYVRDLRVLILALLRLRLAPQLLKR
ncbi:uncharacterized protein BYT42DRAFT_618036 [Radiomyces spectabilis]|uniref:uncharacterized protein n=1 Tax=Radiomyces spectabilis TaxID=64574 RepID=UPI00221E79EE|nr:uncharacterized protein BYT42DRAFT_618036 [Radiomyces spectabilis]KAI8367617.1 hypothetical protein BYT42DRAFT_618036 [Radiomyces spectabilis]